MKKLVLPILASLVLAGCAGGITKSEPVEQGKNLSKICIQEKKTGLNFTSKELVQFFNNSLAKKNIQAEAFTGQLPAHCKHYLAYSFKGKRELIVNGRVRLIEVAADQTKTTLGDVGYKYRGDEKEIAQQIGLQGQIDKIVGQLFQNY
ncbi:hypothetical protein A4G20_10625 [Pasteurellaceae bacterium RH1A]|nr:hypothetical protein A4G20_10625 [Pasteurellaceae bacterium RH1A]